MASPKRFDSDYAARIPDRRMLNIYAADPMLGRRSRYRTVIDINHEPRLERGPSGARSLTSNSSSRSVNAAIVRPSVRALPLSAASDEIIVVVP